MKDKFHIETYREHEILYNADTDKFTVEILVEDNWSEKSRKSLNDCRKAVDDHIKANNGFNPIDVLYGSWHSKLKYPIKIKQVRLDGGFILNRGSNDYSEVSVVQDQLEGKQVSFFEYNPDYVEYLEKRKLLEQKHENELKELDNSAPKLKPLDLSFVNIYKKPN